MNAWRWTLGVLVVAGCSPSAMTLEISNMADAGEPLCDLAQTYLDGERTYETVSAAMYCTDAAGEDCLLRVEAVEAVAAGASSTMILNVSTGAQTLPGSVDMNAPASEPFGADAAVFAATEEVGQEDVARRYDFDCRYDSGELNLDQKPALDAPLSGDFDLMLSCQEQMSPGQRIPVHAVGAFEAMIEVSPYAL